MRMFVVLLALVALAVSEEVTVQDATEKVATRGE